LTDILTSAILLAKLERNLNKVAFDDRRAVKPQ